MSDPKIKLPPGAQLVDDSSSIKLPPGAELVQDAPDLTANENGEGTYEMAGPGGKKVKIPYGMIGTASQAGYKMTDTDRARYVKDASVDPNLNKDKNLPEGVRVSGKNSAGQDILAPEGTAPGSAVSRYASGVGEAVGGAVKGFGKFLDPRPSEEEKKRGLTSTFDILMRYPERIVQPNVDMMSQADADAKAGNNSSVVEHQLAAGIPMVGPWAANVIDTSAEHIARGDIAGAAGNVVGNAIVAEAPGMIGKMGKGAVAAIPRGANSFVEAVTKTSPREVKALAEQTEKENTAAAKTAKDINETRAEKHLGDTIDAVQEANKHSNIEGFRNDELERKNEAARLEFNKKELERVQDEGQKRLEALKKNKDKITDYEERREAVKKQNTANYRREIRQQNLQTKLKTATEKLDTLYQKAFKDATTAYNVPWNKWRDLVKGAKADMSSAVGEIKTQAESMNPQQVTQFREIMRETTPARGDMSELQKMREDIVKSNKFGGSYDTLSPANKEAVDKIIGDLSLDDISNGGSTSGIKDVPAERLHTWKSQLEKAVRTEKDGMVRYAIGKVLDQLRMTEQNVSASVGPDAVKQLTKARAITGPYFDAFFKSPEDLPRAAGQSLREQNPEFAREKGAEQRLERIAKYSPELGAAAKLVSNLKEGLEDLAKERNIGKRSELPIKPDLPSVPPRPEPAGKFQPEPFDAKTGPKNAVVPDRPTTEEAAKKSLSVEDYQKWKAENVAKAAQHIRDLAISRAMYAGMTAIPVSIASFALGHPGAAALELSTPVAVVEFSNAVANLLDKPGVVEYLSRVNSKDVAAFEKLPPKQKALFKDDMRALTKEAKKKGVTISPVFSAFIASPVAGQREKKPTPKELLDEAHRNLQSQFQQQGLAPQ